ncbi:MAG: hypothetical protein EOM21_18570 [Gammaproteobacteria bacterium]|nr:hypothetical protein [Gammaproteobacteria bacterium]
MKLSEQQKQELTKKLDPRFVATRTQSGRQLSYIEGWHAIAEANRIFGHDAWHRETIELIENCAPTTNQKGNHVVSFRAKVRITVGEVTREGIGFGSGISPSIHDAYESAIKEAETDAMKRAFMTFGNPFGLALYDKTQANVGVDVPETDWKKISHDMVNEINGITEMTTLQTFWDGKRHEVENMPETFYDSVDLAYASRVKQLADGSPIPIPYRFQSVKAALDFLKEFGEYVNDCHDLTDLVEYQGRTRRMIDDLDRILSAEKYMKDGKKPAQRARELIDNRLGELTPAAAE